MVYEIIFLTYDLCNLKGNALKDIGRVEEAVQCYNVSVVSFF